jgi:fructose-1,6-bisphosphatase I/sedoheptulose-1,7-bisphosphatase
VDECLAGKTGPRGKDFNMRWIASMVAEAHRILMRGGVFMYPRDTKDPANPGGCACCTRPTRSVSSSSRPAAAPHRPPAHAGVKPTELHQRIGLVFGSKNEVERIERYHTEPVPREENPLFAPRSLFSRLECY